MPLKRDRFVPPAILVAVLTVCGLWLASMPANAAAAAKLPQIAVSHSRGLCPAPFSLKLSSDLPDAVIRYTRDGMEPTSTHGEVYSSPLKISTTTLLRAAAFKDRERVSPIATHSYLFLDQILNQPMEPEGFPGARASRTMMPMAFQMDPRVVGDPVYRDRMVPALRSLPVVSLVGPRDDIFGPSGLYLNSMQRGVEWEKPCSAEMILPDGTTAFQIDCGLRVQGGMNRTRSPKRSFRLLFKDKYGAGKLHYQVFPDSELEKFDTLVLRADYNNSWVHWDPRARLRAQRTRDAWTKDSHRAMGWVASHNRYVHLFLHGLYWGVYDFAERPDARFCAAYLGGSEEDYDVVNEVEPKDGTLDQYTLMASITGLEAKEPYETLQRRLDITNFIDYVLLNYYAGNQDWGEIKNWYAIRRHGPDSKFQYIVWDGEQLLHDVSDNTVTNPFVRPFRMMEELKGNAEFRKAFAARAQKHLFGDGALTPGPAAARWIKRAKEVDTAIIAESARWGYCARAIPYTRDKEWVTEQKRLLTQYFPQRTAILLEQLKEVGLYPNTPLPAGKR